MTDRPDQILSAEEAYEGDHLTMGQVVTYTAFCPEKARLMYAAGERPPRPVDLAIKDAVVEAAAAFYASLVLGGEADENDLRDVIEETVLGDDAKPIAYDTGQTAETIITEACRLAALLRTRAPRPAEITALQPYYRVSLGADVPPLAGRFDLVVKPREDDPPTPVVFVVSKRAWSAAEKVHNPNVTAVATAAMMSGLAPEADPCPVLVLQFVRTTTPKLEAHLVGRTFAQSAELYRTVRGVHRAFEASAFPLCRGWGCSGCQYNGNGCGE